MRSRCPARAALLAALAGLCAVLVAEAAQARRLQMSGTWELRRGGIFVPLQFVVYPTPWFPSPVPSFPNGPVAGLGGVTATGSAPATLRVPRHRFVGMFSTQVPLSGLTLVQITTRIGADGPAATAELAPLGGPGSFTWCPDDPACAAGGGMLSTDPPQGAGARHGRVIYRAGANRFGGTMQIALAGGGSESRIHQLAPFQAAHYPFGFGATQHTGGPYSNTRMSIWPRAVITHPLIPPPAGELITAPGPVVGTGPLPSAFLTHTGFPFTTGTVFAQQTTGTGPNDFFTVMGSDLRTPLGAGNLSLVAGGIARRSVGGPASSFASFGRVQMTFGAPVPSLSPAGAGAAALLLLLAAGYARVSPGTPRSGSRRSRGA